MNGLEVIANVSLIAGLIVIVCGLIVYYAGAFKLYKIAFGRLSNIRASEGLCANYKDSDKCSEVTYMDNVLTAVSFKPKVCSTDATSTRPEGYRIKTFAKAHNGKIVRSINTVEIQIFRYNRGLEKYEVVAEYYLRNKFYNWIFINLLFKKYTKIKKRSLNKKTASQV